MAMLGLLHRVVLGCAPAVFSEFFYPAQAEQFPRSFRAPSLQHSRQLHDHIDGSQPRIFERSAFGLIYTYNILPQQVVDCVTVSSFQRKLQNGVETACEQRWINWPNVLRDGVRSLPLARFHD